MLTFSLMPFLAFWFVCELSFFRPGLYNNAGLRVEPKEPICPHELLWSSKLPGPLSALGAHGVLLVAGELDYSGPFGYCSWAYIFFLGRYISQSAWWNKNSENAIYFEDYF